MKAVFVGTKDDRIFHPGTLAAIAALVEKDNFEENLLIAENTHFFRDMLLLSDRQW